MVCSLGLWLNPIFEVMNLSENYVAGKLLQELHTFSQILLCQRIHFCRLLIWKEATDFGFLRFVQNLTKEKRENPFLQFYKSLKMNDEFIEQLFSTDFTFLRIEQNLDKNNPSSFKLLKIKDEFLKHLHLLSTLYIIIN